MLLFSTLFCHFLEKQRKKTKQLTLNTVISAKNKQY